MAEIRKCPECGVVLAKDAPMGLCVECLLRWGIDAGNANESPSLPPKTSGRHFGGYELLDELGRGGMGVVYRARQRSLNRLVALKMIRSAFLATEMEVHRFLTEAKAVAMLDHPNIVPIYEVGEHEGQPYFGMRLVEGMNLAQRIENKEFQTPDHNSGRVAKLPDLRLSALMITKVARAVHHGHQRGILHRDLKPSNILIDAQGEPHVTDFGLARMISQDGGVTVTGEILGTPEYIPPEQATGKARQLTTSADVYGLGMILYELVTGRVPFKGSTPYATIRQVVEAIAVRPSTINPLVDRDLETICLKCLAKDPAGRYSSAAALADDLERWLRHEPVVARPPSGLDRFQKLVRRNKVAFAAISAVTASLIIGFGTSTWLLVKETEARQRAVSAEKVQKQLRREAQMEAERSTQVARFLQEMLRGVGPSVAKGQDTKMLREILDKTVARLHSDLTNQPVVEAELLHTIAEVYRELGLFGQAEDMHREALGIRRTLLGDEHPDVALSINDMGLALTQAGKRKEGESLIREALAMRRRLFGGDHADVSESINNLAFVLGDQGKAKEAELMHREALAMRRKLFGDESEEVALSLSNIAVILDRQGKLVEAEDTGRQALALRRRVLGNDHPDAAKSMANLAATLLRESKLGEAETLGREGLAIRRKVLGENHPDLYDSIAILADVLAGEAKFAEAEPLNREMLVLKMKLVGSEHPDVAFAASRLGDVLSNLGKLDEAESAHRQALAIFRKVRGDVESAVAVMVDHLAAVLIKKAKLGEAESLYRDELVTLRKTMDSKRRSVEQICSALVNVLLLERKYGEAEQILSEILTPAFQNKPASAALLRIRAAYFARRSRWKEAAMEMANVIEFEPGNHVNYHTLVPMLIASGDSDALRRLCEKMLIKFGGSKDVFIAERTAKDCLTSPSSSTDLNVAARLAQTAVTEGAGNRYLAYLQFAKGLSDYRQGHLDEAMDWMGKAIEICNHPNGRAVEDVLHVQASAVLAMAQFQSKQVDAAKATLAREEKIVDSKLPKFDSDDLGDNWRDVVIAHTLIREAKELIEGLGVTVK